MSSIGRDVALVLGGTIGGILGFSLDAAVIRSIEAKYEDPKKRAIAGIVYAVTGILVFALIVVFIIVVGRREDAKALADQAKDKEEKRRLWMEEFQLLKSLKQ
jgi:hypothetical protein